MSRYRLDAAEAVMKILLRERRISLPHIDLALSQPELEHAAAVLADEGNMVWIDRDGSVIMGRRQRNPTTEATSA